MPPRTPAGDALTDLVLPAFELNGELLAAAEDMTRPVGLTPAWWQVLGATLTEPLPVAEIARRVGLGLARQSVQRVADILVARGWATYSENPAHRRAKLVAPTPTGRAAVASLAEAQHAWANAVGAAVGEEELRRALATMRQVISASRAYRQETDTADEAAALIDKNQGPPPAVETSRTTLSDPTVTKAAVTHRQASVER